MSRRNPSEEEVENEKLTKEIKRIYEDLIRFILGSKYEKNPTFNADYEDLFNHMMLETPMGKIKAEHTTKKVINRNFDTEKPNQKWFTDVTYPLWNGEKAYLCVVIDWYDQSITGQHKEQPHVKKLSEVLLFFNLST